MFRSTVFQICVHCIAQAFSFAVIITHTTFGNQTAHLNAYSVYFKGSVFFLTNIFFLNTK